MKSHYIFFVICLTLCFGARAQHKLKMVGCYSKSGNMEFRAEFPSKFKNLCNPNRRISHDITLQGRDIFCLKLPSYVIHPTYSISEKYIKEVSMKNARNEDQDKEIFNHYYYTRASNIDLISDIVVHKIHERILGNKNSTIESIVYNAFLEIRNNGLKSFYESFFKYEGIDMTKTITYISQPETYWKIREAINLFSRWWKLSQLLQYIPIESIKNENEKVTKKFINEFLNCMLKEISSR